MRPKPVCSSANTTQAVPLDIAPSRSGLRITSEEPALSPLTIIQEVESLQQIIARRRSTTSIAEPTPSSKILESVLNPPQHSGPETSQAPKPVQSSPLHPNLEQLFQWAAQKHRPATDTFLFGSPPRAHESHPQLMGATQQVPDPNAAAQQHSMMWSAILKKPVQIRTSPTDHETIQEMSNTQPPSFSAPEQSSVNLPTDNINEER